MNEQERAEEHLRTIRRLMERATIYRAISAPTALVGGLLSLIASGICLATVSANSHHTFLLLWLLVLLLTAATNTVYIIVGAKKRDEPIFSSSMRAAFAALAPPFLVAAVLTIFMATADSPEEIDLFITWAICYGLGLLATAHFAPRSLVFLGWAFLVSGLGIAATIAFADDLFLTIAMVDIRPAALFMAATFGLFHLIYAACAWPRKGAAPEL